ncbi:complement factor H like 4 precursor [Danio rerio]|uniref:Complement factor H like 4 precursor n=1 Tax=Danio rerio TaxID=7955 RepID=E2FHP8_DANRE|nr:complement factor H like 4 precursor [Danio rerio]ADK32775.1 complement factor H-like 4 protein [Danio rerio]|eukprot:NP_001186295.1 complement factor H like 4 precursor [Danio rerio]
MASSGKLLKMRSGLFILFVWTSLSVDASTPNGCSGIPDEANALVPESSKKDSYNPGDTIDFTCQHGFTSSKKITYVCVEKKWAKLRHGVCSPKRCESPSDILNGHYIRLNGENFAFGTTIRYICNEGYQMMTQTDTRTCRDGGWDNRLPVCEEISCGLNSTETNIKVERLPYDDELIKHGHRLTFSCVGDGLKLEGESEITCQINGEWSSSFPKCVEATCPLNTTMEDLNIERDPDVEGPVKSGHRITFSCIGDGLKLKGQREITCQSNGQWSSPFPKCEEVTCTAKLKGNMKSNIKEQPGREISVKPGQTVTLHCVNKESQLKGQGRIQCQPSGEWNPPFPECTGGICGPPPYVENADTKEMAKTEYKAWEKVEYKCFDKYTLDDRPTYSGFKTCKNGERTGNIYCLNPCSVTLDTMNEKGIKLKYGPPRKIFSPHKDQIQFACLRENERMKGNSKQICSNGTMTLPECV